MTVLVGWYEENGILFLMPYLSNITICLPDKNETFTKQFIEYLSPLGNTEESRINFTLSEESFLPQSSLRFTYIRIPYVLFEFEGRADVKVELTNITNVSKVSQYHYSHITLEEFTSRMEKFPLVGIDHTGFDLPYFKGVHPTILKLREELKDSCLYHTFPKHLEDEPWDFIIPGTKEEIDRSVPVDYNQIRKPKFELVSFDNCSIPLIQIDIQLNGRYEDRKKIFPEAIHDDFLRNMWVYIKNDFGIDVCFVLSEVSERDWSFEFAKERT